MWINSRNISLNAVRDLDMYSLQMILGVLIVLIGIEYLNNYFCMVSMNSEKPNSTLRYIRLIRVRGVISLWIGVVLKSTQETWIITQPWLIMGLLIGGLF